MIYRICITGTESTGKTTLAEELSIHYHTCHVPDYSRYYIDQLKRQYNRTDVLEIAHGIIEQEDHMIQNTGNMLLSDNDLINIKIWLQHYGWEIPEWLEQEIVKRKSHLYLLCAPDLPWVADDQRSNPDEREKLFGMFKSELERVDANFRIVYGVDREQRMKVAVGQIDYLLNPKDN